MPTTFLDIGSINATGLPAFVKGVTLNHGGYVIGPGSALSPGSYSLEASSENLSVSVDVVLKQFINPTVSLLSATNARAQLVNSLYVLVLATTSKNTAKALSENPSRLREFVENSQYSSTDGSILAKRLPLSQAAGLMSGGSFSDSSLSQFSNTIGLDIPLNTSFIFPGQPNPNYLCVFAVSFIDSNADANINIISQNDVALGVPATELIITNGALFTKSTLFYTAPATAGETEPLWVGDVHKDRDGAWRTGPTAAPPNSSTYNGSLLTTKIVYNSKIADHRGVSRLERLQLNLDKISALENLSSKIRAKLKLFAKIRKESMNYLSDVSYAKDENNNLKLFFSFDYVNAVKNNAMYAPLYEASFADLLTTCTILSIKVLRRRVNEPNVFNKLTGGDSPNRIYDHKIDIVGDPIGIPLSGVANPGVLHFYVADSEMDQLTTGLYEYGVELEVLDRSREKITNIFSDPSDGLELLVAQLEDFLHWSLLKGNYDIASNRYTNKFLNIITQNYSIMGSNGNTIIEGPWTSAVLKYIGAISMLFGSQYNVGGLGAPASIKNELLSITDPMTSGPSGIEFLIRLLNNFISSLRSTINADGRVSDSQQTTTANTHGSFSMRKRIFKIRQFFTSAFDADDLIDLGIDMINVVPTPTVSADRLKFLTYDAWRQVATVESTKMGSTEPLAATAGNPTYLTPNFLRGVTTAPLNLYNAYLTEKSDLEQDASLTPEDAKYVATELELAFYRLLQSDLTKNSPLNMNNKTMLTPVPPAGLSTSRVLIAQNKASVMNVNGCVATPLLSKPVSPVIFIFSIPPLDLNATSGDPTEPLDAKVPLGPTSKFVTDASALIDANSGSNSQEATELGAGGGAGNSAGTITANTSVIGSFLLQTDFFNGSSATSSPMKSAQPLVSFNVGSGLKNNNISLGQYATIIKTAKQAIAAKTSTSNNIGTQIVKSTGLPAVISSQIQLTTEQSIPEIAPQEEEFVQQAIAGNLDPSKIVLTALRYGFIYRAEYLSAYAISTATGDTLIKEPIWLGLTLDTVQSAESANKTLLCRLKKHATLMKSFEGIKLPIYNEHFLIGPAGGANEKFAQLPAANPIVIPSPPPPGLLTSLLQYADSIDFSNSYDTTVNPGAAPNPIQQYLLEGTSMPTFFVGAGYVVPGDTSDGGTTPTNLTVPEQRAIFKSFISWYVQLLNGVPRWQKGDGSGQPWMPPAPGSPKHVKGLATLKRLKYGIGIVQSRRDIIEKFEAQTGKSVMGLVPLDAIIALSY